jgi:hypothetical protein
MIQTKKITHTISKTVRRCFFFFFSPFQPMDRIPEDVVWYHLLPCLALDDALHLSASRLGECSLWAAKHLANRAGRISLWCEGDDCSSKKKFRPSSTIESDGPFQLRLYTHGTTEEEENSEDDASSDEEEDKKDIVVVQDELQLRVSTRVDVACQLSIPRMYTNTISDSTHVEEWGVGGSIFCDYQTEGDICSGLFDVDLLWDEGMPDSDDESEHEWRDDDGHTIIEGNRGPDKFVMLLKSLHLGLVHLVHMWSRTVDRLWWIKYVVFHKQQERYDAFQQLIAHCQAHGRQAKLIGADEVFHLALLCMAPHASSSVPLWKQWMDNIDSMQLRCADKIPRACWFRSGGFATGTVWNTLLQSFVKRIPALDAVTNHEPIIEDQTSSRWRPSLTADDYMLVMTYNAHALATAQQERRVELANRLAVQGAVIRPDSQVCRSYIEQTLWVDATRLTLDKTVQIVLDTQFLYEKTDYASRMNQAMTQRLKRRVRQWEDDDEDEEDSDEDDYRGRGRGYYGGGHSYWVYDKSVDQIRKRCKVAALEACAPEHHVQATALLTRVE